MTVTLASAMTALLGSVILPVRDALVDWPHRGITADKTTMAIQANLLMTVVVIQSDRPRTLRSTPTQPSQQIFFLFLRGAKFGEASPRFQALSEWPTAEVIRRHPTARTSKLPASIPA